MREMAYNLVTTLLMIFMIRSGAALAGPGPLRNRRFPWTALSLFALAVAGVALEHGWSGATAALNNDPARTGWWRPVTAVFLQGDNVSGVVFNLVMLAVIAALAEWAWGSPATLALFVTGMLLPSRLDLLGGVSGEVSTDPRNFFGSSGATFFLGATLAAALLIAARTGQQRALAAAVPLLGAASWFLQDNAHGLVAAEGFVLGVASGVVLGVVRGRRGGKKFERPAAPDQPPQAALEDVVAGRRG